jgi:predicted MFS family arabinose efflux permease
MNKALETFRQSFSPLAFPNFRIYLSGQAVSLIGTWLQVTAQGWVVWEISHSNTALGIVGMLATLPILLLGPWAGVWADRLDRRKLLIGTQIGAMMLAFILAVLTQFKLVQLWHVYILSTLLGIITALDMPAQQAFIGDLSGMGEVRKAVVLNAMIINVSRMIGPALAGTIVGLLGAATAFWLNGLSFIAVIFTLVLVRSSQTRKVGHASPLGEFWEGLRFIGTQARLAELITFVVIITFFGLPIFNFFPSIASEILKGDAQTLGWLLAASGAGALLSTIVIVPLAQAQKRVGLVVAGAVVWMGLWFIVMAVSTWQPLSFLSSFAMSIGAPVVFTTANGLLQVLAPTNMRARLLSTFVMLTFGMQPIASLFMGYSAEYLGTPLAMLANGLLIVGAAILMLIVRPELRVWEIGNLAVSPQPVPAAEP